MNNKKHIKILNEWLSMIIRNKGWEKFQDIHIDEIDNNIFKYKTEWIPFAMSIFEYMNSIIDQSKYYLVITIEFKFKKNYKNIGEIKLNSGLLGNTPPSFYLFPKEDPNLKMTLQESKRVFELEGYLKGKVFFNENKKDDGFYPFILVIQNFAN